MRKRFSLPLTWTASLAGFSRATTLPHRSWRPSLPTDSRAHPDGSKLETFTILTTEANEGIRPLHHRMPVILAPADYEVWLSPEPAAAVELMPLMSSHPAKGMRFYPVSQQVNRPINDNPTLIEPVEPPRQQDLL